MCPECQAAAERVHHGTKLCAVCEKPLLFGVAHLRRRVTCGGDCSVRRRAILRVDLTHELLRRLVRYDESSGAFTRSNGAPAEGAARNHGYRVMSVNGRPYLLHRLAWFYVTGAWPVAHIDHINGDKLDNRFSNLRQVTIKLNNQNIRKARSNSKSGMLGAFPAGGRWRAQIKSGGKSVPLGIFDTPREAHEAYLEAKRRVHEGCTL